MQMFSLRSTYAILVLLVAVLQGARRKLSLADQMRWFEISPTLVDNPPNTLCQVTWPFGKLKPGALLRPEALTEQPKVTWRIEKNTLYTLFMTGMEEPRPSSKENLKYRLSIKKGYLYTLSKTGSESEIPEIIFEREWGQWLVINIPGRKIESGTVVLSYITPHAPMRYINHTNRYAFFVYKQVKKIKEYQKYDEEGYPYLDYPRVKSVAQQHNLSDPIAGNYFLVSYNCTSPKEIKNMHKLAAKEEHFTLYDYFNH